MLLPFSACARRDVPALLFFSFLRLHPYFGVLNRTTLSLLSSWFLLEFGSFPSGSSKMIFVYGTLVWPKWAVVGNGLLSCVLFSFRSECIGFLDLLNTVQVPMSLTASFHPRPFFFQCSQHPVTQLMVLINRNAAPCRHSNQPPIFPIQTTSKLRN